MKKRLIRSEFAKIDKDKVLAYAFGEGGSIGHLGLVQIVLDDGIVYEVDVFHDNYEEITLLEISALLPVLNPFGNKERSENISTIQEGWSHIYMGSGNHLYISDSYLLKIDDILLNCPRKLAFEIYTNWNKILINV